MGADVRLRWFVPVALVAVIEQLPAPSTVRVEPETEQGSPDVTAYVVAPSPEPPVVERATVVLFGDGAYVTEVLAATATRVVC